MHEQELHTVQAKVLIKLLYLGKANFAQLNSGLTNDHFSFHINQLVLKGLISKSPDKKYALTRAGKHSALRLDEHSLSMKPSQIVAVLVVCFDEKNQKYLVQKRSKHPYFGYFAFVSGKVSWGEKPVDAAKRHLKKETGLGGDMNLKGVYHKINASKNDEVIEDKYYYVYFCTNYAGMLIPICADGENEWMGESQLKLNADLLKMDRHILDIVQKHGQFFEELTIKNEKY